MFGRRHRTMGSVRLKRTGNDEEDAIEKKVT